MNYVTSTSTESRFLSPCRKSSRVLALVSTIDSITSLAAAPAEVTLGEEIEHVELAGAPVQVREVAAEKPLRGVRETVVVAAEPWVTVAVVEDSDREKSGAPVMVAVIEVEVCDG
jgi:hypothetical protein